MLVNDYEGFLRPICFFVYFILPSAVSAGFVFWMSYYFYGDTTPNFVFWTEAGVTFRRLCGSMLIVEFSGSTPLLPFILAMSNLKLLPRGLVVLCT